MKYIKSLAGSLGVGLALAACTPHEQSERNLGVYNADAPAQLQLEFPGEYQKKDVLAIRLDVDNIDGPTDFNELLSLRTPYLLSTDKGHTCISTSYASTSLIGSTHLRIGHYRVSPTLMSENGEVAGIPIEFEIKK